LRQIGLRLVLDDFGTGYSSLGYLRDYHFDGIKIDRCFMSGIVTSRTDQAIVEAVGHLAASLDMEIVAEGIETAEELKYAHDAGIHNVQGFLMSRPQPAPVVSDMLRRGVTIGDAMALCLRQQTAMRA
jgi:EAL domain-containing protein (putative c-di-GMP-specific phosphodiesterase class I)